VKPIVWRSDFLGLFGVDALKLASFFAHLFGDLSLRNVSTQNGLHLHVGLPVGFVAETVGSRFLVSCHVTVDAVSALYVSNQARLVDVEKFRLQICFLVQE